MIDIVILLSFSTTSFDIDTTLSVRPNSLSTIIQSSIQAREIISSIAASDTPTIATAFYCCSYQVLEDMRGIY